MLVISKSVVSTELLLLQSPDGQLMDRIKHILVKQMIPLIADVMVIEEINYNSGQKEISTQLHVFTVMQWHGIIEKLKLLKGISPQTDEILHGIAKELGAWEGTVNAGK